MCLPDQQLHSEVEKPLMNFRENFKKDMKKCDHHIADLRKQLTSRYAAVEKVRVPDARPGGRGPAGGRGRGARRGSLCQGRGLCPHHPAGQDLVKVRMRTPALGQVGHFPVVLRSPVGTGRAAPAMVGETPSHR